MKKILIQAMVLGMCLVPISGCGAVNSTTPPAAVAPGYLNQADQIMGEVLQSAHALYYRLQQDSLTGKFVPSPAEVTVLNNLQVALNSAQPIYIAYHNGTATQNQAQIAVDSVKQNQAAVQSLIGGK